MLADPKPLRKLRHRRAVIAPLQNERLLAPENFDAFMLPLLVPAGK